MLLPHPGEVIVTGVLDRHPSIAHPSAQGELPHSSLQLSVVRAACVRDRAASWNTVLFHRGPSVNIKAQIVRRTKSGVSICGKCPVAASNSKSARGMAAAYARP